MEVTNKILIMDDEQIVRENLRGKLRRSGFRVSSAVSTNHAINLSYKHQFDAAILDIRMGTESEGLEVVRHLRNLKRDMYLEVLTGHPQYEDEAIAAGADVIAFKPRDTRGNAPLQRLELGIFRKRLESLVEASGLDNSRLDISNLSLKEDVDRIWSSIKATVFRECIGEVKSLIEDRGAQHGLDKHIVAELQNSLIRYFFNHVTSGHLHTTGFSAWSAASPNKDDNSIVLDENTNESEQREHANLKTLSEIENGSDYQGHFVALFNGDIVASATERSELFATLKDTMASGPCLVRRIGDASRVVDLRKPRRVLRD